MCAACLHKRARACGRVCVSLCQCVSVSVCLLAYMFIYVSMCHSHSFTFRITCSMSAVSLLESEEKRYIKAIKNNNNNHVHWDLIQTDTSKCLPRVTEERGGAPHSSLKRFTESLNRTLGGGST